MKNYITLFIAAMTTLLMASCFADDTTLANEETRVHAIVIEGLEDCTKQAYAETLEVTPQVKGFSADELHFNYYITGGQFGDGMTAEGGYREHKIGEGSTLSYPVDLKNGDYTVICEAVHKATGYFVNATFKMKVTSEFSEGFYILKETADGNTDLDFYNYERESMVNSLLTGVYGQPMSGTPRNINTVFQKTFMDEQTATMSYSTAIFVASGTNNMNLFDTTDLSTMFNRSNFHFAEMEDNEVPYGMCSFMSTNYYFSNQGVNVGTFGGSWTVSEYDTGQTGYPVGDGASEFFMPTGNGTVAFWDKTSHKMKYCELDWYGDPTVFDLKFAESYEGERIDFNNGDVINCGWNAIGTTNTIWFLFQMNDGTRKMLFVNKKKLTDVRTVDPSLHMATAKIMAGRGKANNVIYLADGNKTYRYSVAENIETEVSAASLPAGEICYMSNQFYERVFDHLVIGTQNGGNYSIAMYNIEGGQPAGAPVKVINGTGKLKKITYAATYTGDNFNYYPFTSYGGDPTASY